MGLVLCGAHTTFVLCTERADEKRFVFVCDENKLCASNTLGNIHTILSSRARLCTLLASYLFLEHVLHPHVLRSHARIENVLEHANSFSFYKHSFLSALFPGAVDTTSKDNASLGLTTRVIDDPTRRKTPKWTRSSKREGNEKREKVYRKENLPKEPETNAMRTC